MIIDIKKFNESKSKEDIDCICDYCKKIFQRKKNKIINGWKIIKKDACLECKGLKLKESWALKYTKDSEHLKNKREKTKKTCLERYGVEVITQSKEMQNKSKQTCLERYGFENASQSKEIQEKMEKTCIAKYGAKCPSQSLEIKKKSENTCFERYGVRNSFLSLDVQDKRKKTFLKKYGFENPSQATEVKNKRKQTNLERYGVEYYYQSEEMKEKSKQACLEKYGTPYPNFYCGKTQEKIQEWLNSFNFNFQTDREILGGKEIDLLDKDINLGIEYCGLYWHNEQSPEPRYKNYHYEKYIKCLENNIRLITIFEDEWLNRNEQCKNFLLSILNKFTKKIYARKCLVREIKKHDFLSFCEENHIQGKPTLYTVGFGLYFNDELVGVIGLSRHHRQTNKNIIVLNRLCFLKNIQIIGGASKLFSQCIKWSKENNISDIISWSDNRWSQCGIYKILGFQKDEELKPDYSYVDMNNSTVRYSKQSKKKSNLGCPKTITEKEFLLEKGFGRIWDCGKIRWKFHNDLV